jgi:hypothetical protein
MRAERLGMTGKNLVCPEPQAAAYLKKLIEEIASYREKTGCTVSGEPGRGISRCPICP